MSKNDKEGGRWFAGLVLLVAFVVLFITTYKFIGSETPKMPKQFWVFVGSVLACYIALTIVLFLRKGWNQALGVAVSAYFVYFIVLSIMIPANSSFVGEMEEDEEWVSDDNGALIGSACVWRDAAVQRDLQLTYSGNGVYTGVVPDCSGDAGTGYALLFNASAVLKIGSGDFDRLSVTVTVSNTNGITSLYLYLYGDGGDVVRVYPSNFNETYVFGFIPNGEDEFATFRLVKSSGSVYLLEDTIITVGFVPENCSTTYPWWQPTPSSWREIGVGLGGIALALVAVVGVVVMAISEVRGRDRIWILLIAYSIFFMWCLYDGYMFYMGDDAINFNDDFWLQTAGLMEGEKTAYNYAAASVVAGWFAVVFYGSFQVLFLGVRWGVGRGIKKRVSGAKKAAPDGKSDMGRYHKRRGRLTVSNTVSPETYRSWKE